MTGEIEVRLSEDFETMMAGQAGGHAERDADPASAAVFALGAVCWRCGWLGGGDTKLLAACAVLVPPVQFCWAQAAGLATRASRATTTRHIGPPRRRAPTANLFDMYATPRSPRGLASAYFQLLASYTAD